jgi:hypothetical protein
VGDYIRILSVARLTVRTLQGVGSPRTNYNIIPHIKTIDSRAIYIRRALLGVVLI